MSEHHIHLTWNMAPHAKAPATYSRDHRASYSDETGIAVSAAADYLGTASLADPEQLLANALASCHLLYFLALCEGSGYVVESYDDHATAIVEKSAESGMGVSTIILRPRARFSGPKQPDQKTLNRLHERAHKGCFIANSVRSAIRIELEP